MALVFEWHPEKAVQNERKHRVTFEEASTVFDDVDFLMVEDVDHSMDEDRFFTIGWSSAGKLLLVSDTDRADRIRIISAREVTKNERTFYLASL